MILKTWRWKLTLYLMKDGYAVFLRLIFLCDIIIILSISIQYKSVDEDMRYGINFAEKEA
ncbi:hypothetical protein CR203_12655 [Salipaludibacillus neizhouensis]|uniref:Uncharacterized protein n=1 Tax=Salipaludibacillus neizhouensis TaxID=885475 RepID=A0A3A9K0Q4_9BACI|nr:hypothetical protein CR203_12655 [Salipaludibacillus neizhouensis]